MLRNNITLLVLSLFFLYACANIGELKSVSDVIKPKVKVTNTQIQRLSMNDVELAVNLDIDNPNPVAINLAGFDYEVFFNNKQFTRGSQNNKSSIAASGISNVAVPININFAELAKIFKEFKTDNEMSYEVKTIAHLDLPFLGDFPVAGSTKGKLPIPKVPSVSVKSIKIDKLNFTNIDVLVKMNIKNPNAFNLDISDLAYNLTVDGEEWVQSRLKNSLNMLKESDNEIVLPLKLNILKVSGTLLNALKNNEALSYRINGDLKFDTSLPMFKGISLPFDYSARTAAL